MKMRVPVITFVCLVTVVTVCQGRVITVDDDGPADFNNIQAAIDDANDFDTVEVQPGTYTGDGNRDIDFNSKAITVKSKNGPQNCIIDVGSSQSNWHNGFYINKGECETSVIEGFTIKGGFTYQGGGIFCEVSSPTIRNCIITKNTGGWGGGIASYKSNSIISNCLIVKNEGWDAAGGIYCRDSNLKVTGCTISNNNSSDYNGGILCQDTSITIKNCILWENSSEQIEDRGNDSIISVGYSNIESGWPGLGNIDIDPCFVDPGYWDVNGTPGDVNDDFWVDGDYHLKSEGWRWDSVRERWDYDEVTSRCIDAGNPGCGLGEELLSIPDDPCNLWGENLRINMGAYGGTAEASMPPYDWAIVGDLNNDGTVNFQDYAHQAADWDKEEDCQPGDLNHDGTVDINDIALTGEDWLEITSWHEW